MVEKIQEIKNEVEKTFNNYSPALKAFLGLSLRRCMQVLNAETGSLFLFDPQRQELVLNAYHNGKRSVKEVTKTLGEGICGLVADQKVPVLVRDITKDDRFKQNGFGHYKSNSFISVPLLNSFGLIGVINITDKRSHRPFEPRELDLVVLLSDFISLVLENNVTSRSVSNVNTLLQKELQNALEEKQYLNKKAEVLEKFASVGKLAAGIVHEINNPLDGMIRYNNLLLEKERGNDSSSEYLLEIKSGLSRLMNITRSLLEFSRQLNTNTNVIKTKTAEIHSLLNEALSTQYTDLKYIKITKMFSLEPIVISDKGIGYVFSNIIKNAFDSMKDGGSLTVTTGEVDETVFVSFKDTGCGIPNEIKDNIFDPFFTTKKMGQGAGLGLSICYQVIVEKYKGRIAVESVPGEGTKFVIYLPKEKIVNVSNR